MCLGFHDFHHWLDTVGEKPSKLHSLDRTDNDGGYWCGNCEECKSHGRIKNVRWADKLTQANNTSDNVKITFRGKTQTVCEWARQLGVSPKRLHARIRRGWSTEDVLAAPKQKNQHSNNPIHTSDSAQFEAASRYNAGESLEQIAMHFGCCRHTLSNILKKLGVNVTRRRPRLRVM